MFSWVGSATCFIYFLLYKKQDVFFCLHKSMCEGFRKWIAARARGNLRESSIYHRMYVDDVLSVKFTLLCRVDFTREEILLIFTLQIRLIVQISLCFAKWFLQYAAVLLVDVDTTWTEILLIRDYFWKITLRIKVSFPQADSVIFLRSFS